MKKLLFLIGLLFCGGLIMAQSMTTIPKGMSLLAPSNYSYGCASSSDGTIWFSEYNTQQIRQLQTNGSITIRRIGLPGILAMTMDASGNLFVGRDLGDVGNPSKITRITSAGVETDIVSGITRPRGLCLDASGNIYFATESPSRISRWNKATSTVSIIVDSLPYPAEGVAVATDGTLYFSLYGAPESGIAGSVRKRTTGGTITTLTTNFWRGRGLVINAANDYLYLCTEANQEDHGNSGLLLKINTTTGATTNALQGIDYPQFPSIDGNDRIYFTTARDNWLASFDPAATSTDTTWSGNSAVKIGVSGGTWSTSGAGRSVKIKVNEQLEITGNIQPTVTNGTVKVWIRVPENLVSVDSTELYTGCRPAEHPTPGIYRLPSINYISDTGSCLISALTLREHTGQRWPMQNIGTCSEAPASGFDEKPTAYLVYFAWNNSDRVTTILNPAYRELSKGVDIMVGSGQGWIYGGSGFYVSGQTWASSGAYNSSPSTAAWAEFDLGAFSGKSKYIYTMWHKNGPYRPDAARYLVYDYTIDKKLLVIDQTKHADGVSRTDDTFSGWRLLGNGRINITPGTKIRLSQDAPVSATEYLQSDAIMLSDFPIVDNNASGTTSNFESIPQLSVSSSGATGMGSHWAMQGLGGEYTVTNGKTFTVKLDTAVFKEVPSGDYYVEVSWNYFNTDNVNINKARYLVKGVTTTDSINQNRSAGNQAGSFVAGNSVGTWSGFYRLAGTYNHTPSSPITVAMTYNSSVHAGKRMVLDMVRFVPVSGTGNQGYLVLQEEPEKVNFSFNISPNPLRGQSTISYSLPAADQVIVRIYDNNGRIVATPVNGKQSEGVHRVLFQSAGLPAGTYYCVLQTKNNRVIKSLVIIP